MKTNFSAYKDELGIGEVEHKIPEGDPTRWGKVDLYIWVDAGEDGLPVEKIVCPKPNVYWVSDSHLGLEYRLNKAKEFDYVFVSIPEHIDKFKEAVGHDKVYFLPHAGEPSCYYSTEHIDLFKEHFLKTMAIGLKPRVDIEKKVAVMKKYDVAFIGHLPNEERINLIDRLFKEFPEFYYGNVFFEEANAIYNKSKIVLNHCISNEANMRLFEATLSGALVLSNKPNTADELGYIDGVNIAFYKDADEMVAKAKYYIEHEDDAKKIAYAGMLHTLNNHSYLHRAKRIMEVVNADKKL